MKILLDGYADHNLGDDLMLTLAANELREHELYTVLSEFDIDNVEYTTLKSGFDVYLKVIGSGFLIHNNLGVLYRMRDMLRERKYAQRRAVINCNISHFISRGAEKAIQRQLKDYELITVRDEFSYEYIKKNAPNVQCRKYPDMVLSVPDSMIPNTSCENALGIAVHNSADSKTLSYITDRYIEETGNNVILLCFDSGMENDIAMAEKVRQTAKYKDKVEIVKYTSISNILANMKRCGVILGIRFHSAILSARMNIPFVPVAYSEKTINALKEIKYDSTIYTSDCTDADGMLRDILNAKPFNIDKKIISDAKNHISDFCKYIEKQV